MLLPQRLRACLPTTIDSTGSMLWALSPFAFDSLQSMGQPAPSVASRRYALTTRNYASLFAKDGIAIDVHFMMRHV